MTDQDRIIYEQDKLIAKLQTELEIKNKQLDGIMEYWKNGGGCPPMIDKECGDFETCEECMRYFLDQVGKQ